MHKHTHGIHHRIILISIFLAFSAFLNLACKSESAVTSDGNDAAQTGVAPSPAAAVTPAANPSAVQATPVGPTGQTTPAGEPTAQANPQQNEGKIITSDAGAFSPAKPAMTPALDPFPPRPEPTVVMKDGKIIQQWQAPAEALSLTSPVKDNPEAVKIGRAYYMQRCGDCHGKEGKGNGWMSKMVGKPPTNLTGKMVQANSDGELYWKITNGKSPMPANRVRFTDEQRWYIVAYLRTLKP